MEKNLKKLVQFCEDLGEHVVEEHMYECYCDGAQGTDIIDSTVRSLEDLVKNTP